ncbi:MAG: CehA/McbA family metallohydrolase, partial [Planctomycetales bacterium]|nr:CehA/McbA family metallohydrolase [Planctomycetales bacterium]
PGTSPWAADREPSKVVIEPEMTHVRSAAAREWAWYPETPKQQLFERQFSSRANDEEWTLTLRQHDVKQTWDVRLNDRSIGRLTRDENAMQVDFAVPSGVVVDGDNQLEIRQSGDESDDISIGHVELRHESIKSFRNQATAKVNLVDTTGSPIPGRITILDHEGTLIPVGETSDEGLAIREGVVYTAHGSATFGVAGGDYRIVASRGFEYSVAEAKVSLDRGRHQDVTLQLDREVDSAGWVACDTHVHTVTHSGHGDCTIDERMSTLVGEGIELPIATDHNKAIDYRPVMSANGVTKYFTAVIGDECTTKKGHFNIFPIQTDAPLPDHTQEDWGQLLDDIFSTPSVRVAILNHARDIHSGFRPFSPRHHISLSGENLDGRPMRFNAMEIINSGAVQTDAMQLFHDWCGLTNRGLSVTPVGSSDSHDVARFIVGQGRTYIRCADSEPSNIDIQQALDAFVAGRVIVSYGLMTKMTVGHGSGPGDLVTLREEERDIVVDVEVHGPSWVSADFVALYVCGREKFRVPIDQSSQNGTSVKTKATWRIPKSEYSHDLWMSAVAVGPGIEAPFWATALPYQPTSTSFSPYVFSSTGAVQVDIDGDGIYTSPYAHALDLVKRYKNDQAALLKHLVGTDASVIHQVASLLRESELDLASIELLAENEIATEIARYRRAYQQSVVARLESVE